jgi:hypothetical protein
MNKILIITDSHGSTIQNTFYRYVLRKIKKIEKIEKNVLFRGNVINGLSVDIIALNGKSAYNFVNHLDIIKNKEYGNHKIVLFMGFHDPLKIKKYNNTKVAVEQYVLSAINVFGKDNVVFITPLKNMLRIQADPNLENIYEGYVDYLKQCCQEENVKCYDVYSIIGDTSVEDLIDDIHIDPAKFLPLLNHLNII